VLTSPFPGIASTLFGLQHQARRTSEEVLAALSNPTPSALDQAT
jgi:hypothetical protein